MPLRNARALTFRPQGVSDAADGTNTFPGALAVASDLIPSLHTRNVWVPRPATVPFVDFGRPVTGENLLIVGLKIYGFVTSARFPGYSEPFAYNVATRNFIPITGVTAGNVPKSAPATGDWTPPTSVPVGAYIIFTHPGFALPNAFGWLDMTGLQDTATGSAGFSLFAAVWDTAHWDEDQWDVLNPAGGNVVAGLSKNVLQAGWRPGMLISDSAGVIPPGTRIADVSVDGLSLLLTQSALGGAPNDTFTVRGGTPAQPLWAAGNTAINHQVGVPVAVTQFNGRAWFAIGSATSFTDALNPLVQTNANQVLTYNNGLDVTAFAAIPLATQLGGIVQSLLVFQGDAAIQQIQGDQATQNLSRNLLSEIGTLAPNAIVSTPSGVVFVAPDGLRVVSQAGQVGDPIGAQGDGVAMPFAHAVYPSRMCASYNEDVIRVSSTYNKSDAGVVTGAVMSSEFGYHLKVKMWSGPHSFAAALIAPLSLDISRFGHLLFPLDPSAQGIWFSNTHPVLGSSYVENRQPMNWVYETSLLPDTQSMFMNCINETTVMLSLAPSGVADVMMKADDGALLDHVQLNGFPPRGGSWGVAVWGNARWGGPPAPASLWGLAIWGQNMWGELVGAAVLAQRLVPWDKSLIFKQGRLLVSGPSGPSVAVGNIYMRYQQTGYTITDLSGVSS